MLLVLPLILFAHESTFPTYEGAQIIPSASFPLDRVQPSAGSSHLTSDSLRRDNGITRSTHPLPPSPDHHFNLLYYLSNHKKRRSKEESVLIRHHES